MYTRPDWELRASNLLFDKLDPKGIIFATTKLESDVEQGLDFFFLDVYHWS